MWGGLFLRAACVALLLPGAPARGYTGRKPPGHFATERRRLGPHVCLSGFGSGCCPGWAPSVGSGHCTLPLCSFGCGSGTCIAPNVCSCQDGEQGATCPEGHGPCGEYGCDLTCNHGGCQEVARVCPVGFSMTETAVGIRCTEWDQNWACARWDWRRLGRRSPPRDSDIGKRREANPQNCCICSWF